MEDEEINFYDEFDFSDDPMSVDDWRKLFEFLKRKGKIHRELPLDAFEWEKRLMSGEKAKWAGILGMHSEEFESFLFNFFKDSISAISKGSAVAFVDYTRKIKNLYNIPIEWDKLPVEMKQNLPKQLTCVSNFLGLITDKNDKMYGRVCRINSHDWRESGNYFVTFADNSHRTYKDESMQFQKFYRKPFFLNPSTFPTFEKFLLTFQNLGGNLEQLIKDYQSLFQEELPKPSQGLLKYIK